MVSHEKDPTVGWFGWNWKTAIGVVYFSTKKRGDVLERWLDDGWVIHLPGLLGIMNLFMGMPGFIKQNFMGWENGMLFFIQTKKTCNTSAVNFQSAWHPGFIPGIPTVMRYKQLIGLAGGMTKKDGQPLVWVGFFRWKPCTAEYQTQYSMFSPYFAGYLTLSIAGVDSWVCLKIGYKKRFDASKWLQTFQTSFFPSIFLQFFGNSDPNFSELQTNFSMKSSFIPFRSQLSGWWRTTWRWYRTNRPKCPSTRCWWVRWVEMISLYIIYPSHLIWIIWFQNDWHFREL